MDEDENHDVINEVKKSLDKQEEDIEKQEQAVKKIADENKEDEN